LRDAVDVGGMVAHHSFAEMADVPNADIVSPNDEDIWFARLSHATLLGLNCLLELPV